MLAQTAINDPNTTSIFLSYTRQSARDTIQKPLADLLRRHQIQFEYLVSLQTFKLDNGSKIVLRGADKPAEIDKLRGQANPLAVIDECGHGAYNNRLEYIVNEVIEPCVAQHDGTIVLIGTPGITGLGFFYDITGPTPAETGWSVHHWSWDENTAVEKGTRICDQIAKTLSARLKRDPAYQTTDGYRREWLGQWVLDPEQLCYRYDPARNLIPQLPRNTYRYIIGVDPASNDGTAFVVGAYAQNDPTLYIVESEKIKQLDITDIATKTKALAQRYTPTVSYVIDGASKQGVEEMRRRFNIYWKSTPKAPNYKYDAIQMMNGDFRAGAIKLVAGKNNALTKELQTLVWDPKNPTREKQSIPNDLCDAALYTHIESKHWLARPDTQDDYQDPSEPPRRYFDIVRDAETTDTNLFDYLDAMTELMK